MKDEWKLQSLLLRQGPQSPSFSKRFTVSIGLTTWCHPVGKRRASGPGLEVGNEDSRTQVPKSGGTSMAQNPAEPFFLILRDEDKKKFNIVGPMTDDSDYAQRTMELQEQGRDVRCQSIRIDVGMPEIAARDRAVTEYKKAFPDHVFDPTLQW